MSILESCASKTRPQILALDEMHKVHPPVGGSSSASGAKTGSQAWQQQPTRIPVTNVSIHVIVSHTLDRVIFTLQIIIIICM